MSLFIYYFWISSVPLNVWLLYQEWTGRRLHEVFKVFLVLITARVKLQADQVWGAVLTPLCCTPGSFWGASCPRGNSLSLLQEQWQGVILTCDNEFTFCFPLPWRYLNVTVDNYIFSVCRLLPAGGAAMIFGSNKMYDWMVFSDWCLRVGAGL